MSSAENVHHEHRFKNRAAYLLKTFIDINITCLGFLRRVFGENFQAPPTNKDMIFVTVPFSLMR